MVTVYKPKLHLVVDIETLSTDKRAAVVEIAAVAMLPGYPDFSVAIKPSYYPGTNFEIDQSTVDWHGKIHPEYLGRIESSGVSFQEAALSFVDWVNNINAGCELHLWSQGKDFDFPILDWLFAQCGIKSPWAYSRVHCLRDLVWLNPGARLQRPADSIQHEALSDAQFEMAQLIKVVNSNTWYPRLFK